MKPLVPATPPPPRMGPLPPPSLPPHAHAGAGPLPRRSLPPLHGPAARQSGGAEQGASTLGGEFAVFVSASGPVATPEEKTIANHLIDLEVWGLASERRARWNVMRFWILNVLAFLCAVAALGAELYSDGETVAVFGAVAAGAIAFDAAWSGPKSYVLKRAISEIRNLQNAVKLRWDKVVIAHPDPTDPVRSSEARAILEAARAESEDIEQYAPNPKPA